MFTTVSDEYGPMRAVSADGKTLLEVTEDAAYGANFSIALSRATGRWSNQNATIVQIMPDFDTAAKQFAKICGAWELTRVQE